MKRYATKFDLSMMSVTLITTLSFSSIAMAADSDGDSVDDRIERMYGWNPYDANSPGKADYDGDGLTDLTEFKAFTNIYDANKPVLDGASDNDHDNLPKGLEVFLMGTNPDKADTDCDGQNDDVDVNPVDGSCAPNPGANMTDDIRIDDNPVDNQVFSIGVPFQLIYTVEYANSPPISTSAIDDDSTYMTWEVSALGNNNLAHVDLDKITGQLTFNAGVNKDDEFTVKASVNEYPDVFDEIIVVAGGGIPEGDSEIKIQGNSSDHQSFPKGESIALKYTVDYTDGEPITTNGINDSDSMSWTVSPSDDVSLDVNTGILVFEDGFNVGETVTVTASLNDDPTITDSIDVVAEDAIQRVLTIQRIKHAKEPSTDGSFRLTVTPVFNVATVINFNVTGTATNGTDYKTIQNSLTFPANTTTKSISVDVTNDTKIENTETVKITLSASNDYVLSSSKTATVNIEDQINKVSMQVRNRCVAGNGKAELWTYFKQTSGKTAWAKEGSVWYQIPSSHNWQEVRHQSHGSARLWADFRHSYDGISNNFYTDQNKCRYALFHDANYDRTDNYNGYSQKP